MTREYQEFNPDGHSTRVRLPKNIRDLGYIDVKESREWLIRQVQAAGGHTMIKLTSYDDGRVLTVKASLIQAVE
jgi:hypothetical protein